MLKSVFSVLLGLSLALGGIAYANTAKKSTAKSRTAVKASPPSKAKSQAARSTSSSAQKSAGSSGKKSTTRTASKKSHKASPPVARRSTQQVPTPERYQQIQQALADKGYYEGGVNGMWNAESLDALKRFQKDQNLTPNGKLDALTIMALGLGPKRDLNARSTEARSTEDDHRRPEGSERP